MGLFANSSEKAEYYRQQDEAKKVKEAVEFQDKLNFILDVVEVYDFMENELPVIVKTLENNY